MEKFGGCGVGGCGVGGCGQISWQQVGKNGKW